MILELLQRHLDLLKRETKKVYPIEACAILFGKYSEKKVKLEEVKIVPNLLQSSTKFEIDPTIFVAAFYMADEKGLDFIGLFHSHPASSVPSVVDLKYMKFWEGNLWLILSTTDDTFGAYMLEDSEVKKIPIFIN